MEYNDDRPSEDRAVRYSHCYPGSQYNACDRAFNLTKQNRILFINHGNSLCYEELCFANRVLETCVKFIIFCLCKVYHYFWAHVGLKVEVCKIKLTERLKQPSFKLCIK